MKRLRIVVLMLMCAMSVTLQAQQEVTVKSFSMTTDHIPGDARRNDMNGTPCALLKVQVLDDIEGVDGNKIGDIVDRGVEKWIYLCRGSRNVRLRLKNHLPVRVMFKDYQITSLESNRVYELVLETPAPAPIDMTGVKGNNLQMHIIPKDAVVVIWNDNLPKRLERPDDKGILKVYLPYGRYYYSAEAAGFIRKEGDLFVNDEDKVVDVRMSPEQGQLTVKCSAKVDVFVNGVVMEKDRKSKDWQGQYPVGNYIVEARAKGYVPKLTHAQVTAGQTTVVDFKDVITEKDAKKKNIPIIDEAASLRESVLNVQKKIEDRKAAEWQNYLSRVEAMKRENAYDVITMVDGSTILCRVSRVGSQSVSLTQKGMEGEARLPIRQIDNIRYSNGDFKSFK